MSDTTDPLPGNARYYERHIYPRLAETLALSPDDPPSTLIDWIARMGIIDTTAAISVLEIGCGAGRNLKRLRALLPRARLCGFDGSSLALRMARRVLPDVSLRHGDIYGPWPFDWPFDLVVDITAGIPESATAEDLDTYVRTLSGALPEGGYAAVEAIASSDTASRRFGDGRVVTWRRGQDTKPERLVSTDEAVELYEAQGLHVLAVRVDRVAGASFKDTSPTEREFLQLVMRKPLPT